MLTWRRRARLSECIDVRAAATARLAAARLKAVEGATTLDQTRNARAARLAAIKRERVLRPRRAGHLTCMIRAREERRRRLAGGRDRLVRRRPRAHSRAALDRSAHRPRRFVTRHFFFSPTHALRPGERGLRRSRARVGVLAWVHAERKKTTPGLFPSSGDHILK